MTDRKLALQWVLTLLCLFCGGLQAQSGAAAIADEATVYEEETNNNGGAGSEVCIGNLATTSTRRAFVRYTLPAIPAGAIIERVVLELLQDRVRSKGTGTPKAATLVVRRVTADWVEGTGSGLGTGPCGGGENVAGVDWTSAPAVAAANSADAALSASDNVNIVIDSDTGSSDDGLINDVQAWADGDASNFGWRLAVAEEGTNDNSRVLLPGTLMIYWSVQAEDLIFLNGFESLP
jgi:hypothetical protein